MRNALLVTWLAVAACSDPARTLVTGDAAVETDATVAAESGCANDRQCDDRIACTVDHCRAGLCSHEPCTDCCPSGLQCVEGLGCGRAPAPCTMDAECSDGIRCTLDRCRDGRVCEHSPQGGLCESGEICLAAVGCVPRPPDSCRVDDDCNVTPCRGTWRCAPELGCEFRSATNCDDGDACTADTCNDARGGCQHAPRDDDGDGRGPVSCGGDDCDDTNRARLPGATEICGNGVDEDCDGSDRGCCTANQACTTACGSAGLTACTPAGTAAPCVAPAETCNGRDDNCDGASDEGFACVQGSSGTCTTACGSAGTRACGPGCAWGPCAAPAETCNGRDDNCDGASDEGFACAAGASGPCATACGSTGRRTCLGSCAWDACVPPAETCNGVDDNCNATCDEGFTCCARATRDCTALGFVGGTATCRADCGGWDTAGCTNCGNRTREGAEQCDGADLAGATCASRGFGGGTLRCRTDCTFDTTGCGACGNGRVDAGEQCDGAALNGQTCAGLGMGFSGGTLRCGPSCTFDSAMCTRAFNPTGTWVVSPGVNLYCAFGAVSFSFGNLSFTDTGAGLSVSGGRVACTMTGPSARTTRMVNVTCTLTGGCNETYTLTGTFGTDNAFTGTFTAAYTGGGCFDCRTRTFAVSGSR